MNPIRDEQIVCTMKCSTEFCKLQKHGYAAIKYPGYKAPKLSELASALSIKTSDDRLHDASYDCEITKQCVIEGRKIGLFRSEIEQASMNGIDNDCAATAIKSNINKKTVKQLKDIAKDAGLQFHSKIKKPDLIELIADSKTAPLNPDTNKKTI
jgi:DNA polymerase III epsilon subunit-like protein